MRFFMRLLYCSFCKAVLIMQNATLVTVSWQARWTSWASWRKTYHPSQTRSCQFRTTLQRSLMTYSTTVCSKRRQVWNNLSVLEAASLTEWHPLVTITLTPVFLYFYQAQFSIKTRSLLMPRFLAYSWYAKKYFRYRIKLQRKVNRMRWVGSNARISKLELSQNSLPKLVIIVKSFFEL